jgi:hypothetical protein
MLKAKEKLERRGAAVFFVRITPRKRSRRWARMLTGV